MGPSGRRLLVEGREDVESQLALVDLPPTPCQPGAPCEPRLRVVTEGHVLRTRIGPGPSGAVDDGRGQPDMGVGLRRECSPTGDSMSVNGPIADLPAPRRQLADRAGRRSPHRSAPRGDGKCRDPGCRRLDRIARVRAIGAQVDATPHFAPAEHLGGHGWMKRLETGRSVRVLGGRGPYRMTVPEPGLHPAVPSMVRWPSARSMLGIVHVARRPTSR